MARAQQEIQRNNFSKGFLPDISYTNAVPGATVDEENFDLNIDGSRSKRKGLVKHKEIDVSGDSDSLIPYTEGPEVHYWKNAGQEENTEIVIAKIGGYLYFFKDNDDTPGDFIGDISNNLISGLELKQFASVSLTSDIEEEIRKNPIETTSINGDLVLTAKWLKPLRIKYFESSNAFSYRFIHIRQRDFEGAQENIPPSYRYPTSVNSEAHTYNLYNQGWNPNIISNYETDEGVQPSNSEIPHLGWYVDSSSPDTRSWSSQLVTSQTRRVSSVAPKGSMIHSVFKKKYPLKNNTNTNIRFSAVSTKSGSTNDTIILEFDQAHNISSGSGDDLYCWDILLQYQETTGISFNRLDLNETRLIEGTDFNVESSNSIELISPEILSGSSVVILEYGFADSSPFLIPSEDQYEDEKYFTCCASFAGRVWYGGGQHPELRDSIFFSQIVQKWEDLGNCYQAADPTAESINELVDDDGGVIQISGLGQALKLVEVNNQLVVFSDQGIWLISGGQGGYFKATDFSVRRIYSGNIFGTNHIIKTENTVYFWADNNIYRLAEDKVTGYLSVENISQGRVYSYLKDIPPDSISSIRAEYNSLNKTIYWSFSIDPEFPEQHDTILCYDLRLESFYKYRISQSGDPYLAALASSRFVIDNKYKIQALTIYVSGDSSTGMAFTFSTFSSDDFVDWQTEGYEGILNLQYEFGEDLLREKQTIYVTTFCQTTERNWEQDGSGNWVFDDPSSLELVGRWDWSGTLSSHKWSNSQQAYRLPHIGFAPSSAGPVDYKFDVVSTKLKIRGRGKTLQLKYTSPAGYNAHILAYGLPMLINEKV